MTIDLIDALKESPPIREWTALDNPYWRLETIPTHDDRDTAIVYLRNMQQIALNDQLVRGAYITEERDDERFESGAMCKGHQACAIGSYLLGSSVEPVQDIDPENGRLRWLIVGSEVPERHDIADQDPAFALGLDALNVVAAEFIDAKEVGPAAFQDPIEALFESDHFDMRLFIDDQDSDDDAIDSDGNRWDDDESDGDKYVYAEMVRSDDGESNVPVQLALTMRDLINQAINRIEKLPVAA